VDDLEFELSRTGGASVSLPEKKSLVDRWQRRMLSILRAQRFETTDDPQIRRSIEDSKTKMLDALPYAKREHDKETMGREILLAINNTSPSCSANDEGAIAVVLMVIYPDDDVMSDYGSLEVEFMGLGACGRSTGSAPGYIASLKRKLTDDFVAYIKGQP
jgi:hypothetical protein